MVRDEDVARLSPLIHGHIHVLGGYSFWMPESVAKGKLRPLRNPAQNPDERYSIAFHSVTWA